MCQSSPTRKSEDKCLTRTDAGIGDFVAAGLPTFIIVSFVVCLAALHAIKQLYLDSARIVMKYLVSEHTTGSVSVALCEEQRIPLILTTLAIILTTTIHPNAFNLPLLFSAALRRVIAIANSRRSIVDCTNDLVAYLLLEASHPSKRNEPFNSPIHSPGFKSCDEKNLECDALVDDNSCQNSSTPDFAPFATSSPFQSIMSISETFKYLSLEEDSKVHLASLVSSPTPDENTLVSHFLTPKRGSFRLDDYFKGKPFIVPTGSVQDEERFSGKRLVDEECAVNVFGDGIAGCHHLGPLHSTPRKDLHSLPETHILEELFEGIEAKARKESHRRSLSSSIFSPRRTASSFRRRAVSSHEDLSEGFQLLLSTAEARGHDISASLYSVEVD